MKMKKFTALAAVCALLLTGCNKTDSGSSAPASTPAPAVSEPAPAVSEPESSAPAASVSADSIAQAGLNCGAEFPFMEKVEDPETIEMIFGLKTEWCDDLAVYFTQMSTHNTEVIVAKYKEDKKAEVLGALESHVAMKKQDNILYEGMEEALNGAVTAEYNGYVYNVIHAEGSRIEDAMKAAIKG